MVTHLFSLVSTHISNKVDLSQLLVRMLGKVVIGAKDLANDEIDGLPSNKN